MAERRPAQADVEAIEEAREAAICELELFEFWRGARELLLGRGRADDASGLEARQRGVKSL